MIYLGSSVSKPAEKISDLGPSAKAQRAGALSRTGVCSVCLTFLFGIDPEPCSQAKLHQMLDPVWFAIRSDVSSGGSFCGVCAAAS